MRFRQTAAFRWTALLAGALAWRRILFFGERVETEDIRIYRLP